MKELKIIKRELRKLSEKGIGLDIVRNTICLVDFNKDPDDQNFTIAIF